MSLSWATFGEEHEQGGEDQVKGRSLRGSQPPPRVGNAVKKKNLEMQPLLCAEDRELGSSKLRIDSCPSAGEKRRGFRTLRIGYAARAGERAGERANSRCDVFPRYLFGGCLRPIGRYVSYSADRSLRASSREIKYRSGQFYVRARGWRPSCFGNKKTP